MTFSNEFFEQFFGKNVVIVMEGGILGQGVLLGWMEGGMDVLMMESMFKRKKQSNIATVGVPPGSVGIEVVKTRKYFLPRAVLSLDSLPNPDVDQEDEGK